MKKLSQIPAHERPREKLLNRGPAALSDLELLAILLGSGNKSVDVMTLANRVLNVLQGRLVKEDMDPARVRLWLFAHNGLTKPALDFARKHDILWSARKEFDELLAHLGLRTLPDF